MLKAFWASWVFLREVLHGFSMKMAQIFVPYSRLHFVRNGFGIPPDSHCKKKGTIGSKHRVREIDKKCESGLQATGGGKQGNGKKRKLTEKNWMGNTMHVWRQCAIFLRGKQQLTFFCSMFTPRERWKVFSILMVCRSQTEWLLLPSFNCF